MFDLAKKIRRLAAIERRLSARMVRVQREVLVAAGVLSVEKSRGSLNGVRVALVPFYAAKKRRDELLLLLFLVRCRLALSRAGAAGDDRGPDAERVESGALFARTGT